MKIAVNNARLAEAIADPDKTRTFTDIIAAVTLASSHAHDFSVMLKRAMDHARVDAETTM